MRLGVWAVAALSLLAADLWGQQAAGDRAAAATPGEMAGEANSPLVPGLYASRQSFSAIVKTPPLGRRQTGITVSFALHDVTLEDGILMASTRFCSVEPIPFGGVKSTMPEEFIAAMASPRVAVQVEGPEGGPWTVDFDQWTIVIGAELDDPASDPLPEDKKDPRVTDPDDDGKPGATVHLSGMIKGRTYVVQRLTRGMHGSLTADGRMKGTLSGRAEQTTLGASNPLLGKFKAVFLDETVAAHNVFEWLPVTEGTTCAELVDGAATLFE